MYVQQQSYEDSRTHLHLGKTNAAGYELYGFFGEANGQSLPLGFIFTKMTDGSAKPGRC
jgi:hypothetical protein